MPVAQSLRLRVRSASLLSRGPGKCPCSGSAPRLLSVVRMTVMAIPAEGASSPDVTPRLDVLVVDDDENARNVMLSAVRMLGHLCRVASNGPDALRMHAAKPADVVICDWRMEGMDGIELCRRIRAAESARYTYLLFVSADATKRDFVAAAWRQPRRTAIHPSAVRSRGRTVRFTGSRPRAATRSSPKRDVTGERKGTSGHEAREPHCSAA